MNERRKTQFFDLLEDYERRVLADPTLILFKEKAEIEKKRIYSFLKGEDHNHKFEVYLLVASNGCKYYRYGCPACGHMQPGFIPHKKLTYEQRAHPRPRSEFYEGQEYWQIVSETYQQLWQQAYFAYLETEAWKDIRHRVFERDELQCRMNYEGCTYQAQQAHHLTYVRIGRESLEDLISVCESCHSKIPSVFHD